MYSSFNITLEYQYLFHRKFVLETILPKIICSQKIIKYLLILIDMLYPSSHGNIDVYPLIKSKII